MVLSGMGMKMTTHLQLVLRSGKLGAIYLWEVSMEGSLSHTLSYTFIV
jgi:hypothetical protein